VGAIRFYAGLFLVTACTLMMQLVQTRILSVVAWYHLAFFAISMAMFGLTAGAIWVYLRGAWCAVQRKDPLRRPQLLQRIVCIEHSHLFCDSDDTCAFGTRNRDHGQYYLGLA